MNVQAAAYVPARYAALPVFAEVPTSRLQYDHGQWLQDDTEPEDREGPVEVSLHVETMIVNGYNIAEKTEIYFAFASTASHSLQNLN